ncbi:MAG: ATP-binding cassette domain-containing protein [Lachnospiraceae bacterium]|jgi:ABC-type bacteriocin/lantibiotic exporter with double-glycine peptidase domain|nr:ATP-binding cassette domain-containing protein [Lachnospiraceae bacterium]
MASVVGANKTVVLYVFLLNIILLIPVVLSPIFKKVFTDYILTDGITEWMAPLLILMTGTALLSAAVTWIKKSCLLRLSNKIEISGAGKYMWLMLNSPPSLFRHKDSYQLLSQVNASQRVSKLLTRDLLDLLFNIVSAAFYMVMMLRLDLLMSVIVVVLVVLNFLMLQLKEFITDRLAQEAAPPDLYDLMIQDERIGSAALENIETYKSTASEMSLMKNLLSSKFSIINARRDQDLEEASEPLESLSEVIFLNLLLLISAFRIMDRSFSVGAYLAFQAYASAFFFPLSEVLNARRLFEKFEKRLKKLYKELDTDEEVTPRDWPAPNGSEKLEGYIEVKNVGFRYDDGPLVLEDINISVKPGQRVAVLGHSGAGKTTLLKLLQGLYEPGAGEIAIDGVPPMRMEKDLFAKSIGCANQDVTIFAASVRDNITMWDGGISDADVYHAASDACIHEHIAKLVGAYEYRLSENGNNLSGGEKQRMEIARALLHNPSIVLLDEATAAIDPENRVKIEGNLVKRGCTCIVATNVVAQLPEYDEIIVLDKGKIAHRGTHQELLRSSTFYYSLFQEEGLVAGA